MTVAELIEKLRELPQDYTVVAVDADGNYTVTDVYNYGEPIKEIELS